MFFFFSSRRRHTRLQGDWSSDVCSSDLAAAREAWADAGSPDVDPLRLGVVVASGIGGIGSVLAAYDTLREKGWQRLSPFTVPQLMPNGSAGWISLELGARAGVHTPVS